MADAGNPTPPGEGGEPTPAEKTFSQSELDSIVKDRLQRERGKYADYDDLKKAAAKLREMEDANKSEAEKLTGRLADIEKALGLKDAAIKDLESRLAGEKRANIAQAVAARLGAHDPSDANVLAAVASIDPAGENAESQIEAALKALQEKKPYLFRQQQGTPNGGMGPLAPMNPGSRSGGAETDQQRMQRIQAQTTGHRNYGPLGRG